MARHILYSDLHCPNCGKDPCLCTDGSIHSHVKCRLCGPAIGTKEWFDWLLKVAEEKEWLDGTHPAYRK